jgi:stearoyl-CoA desaturase (delta-9 desaturase)
MNEIIYLLLTTHITIICVTLYLHRGQAHRLVKFHPAVSHFMRFWLWLTTGMITKQWVAVHRKHHRYCEEQGDPHSPHIYGILKVLFGGAFLYANASKDKDMVRQYGIGTPNDWIENNLYTKFPWLGIILLLAINLLWFSYWGLIIWAIQMIWIPFWAAGVINGIGHYLGYRNGETNDKSRNIFPLDLLVGGECLHNNHHLDPANAKLSRRWFEFDSGWMYLSILRFFRLATVKTSVS